MASTTREVELPAALLERALSRCAGDVATLCAAACVARAWRDAAAAPALWLSLDLTSPRVRANATAERLAALLARSRSADTGVDAPPLTLLDLSFCEQLTANEVLTALQGRRICGELRLRGVRAEPYQGRLLDDPYVDDEDFDFRELLEALRAVLTPEADVRPCGTKRRSPSL